MNASVQTKVRENNRRVIEKACQAAVLFRTKGDRPGLWRTASLDIAPMPQIREALEQRYGHITVLNDLIATDPYAWEK